MVEKSLSVEETVVGGLKTWLHWGSDTPKVLLVLIHGRTRSHHDTDKFAAKLCEKVPEVVCCTFDLPNHGQRLVDEKLNLQWADGNAFHLTTMTAILDQGATEAKSLLEFLPMMYPKLSQCRRAASGISLGGHIVWKLAAEMNPDGELLDAAIPIISTPDLASLYEQRFEKEMSAISAQKISPVVALPPKMLEKLKANRALRYDIHNTNLPLLAICGAIDPLVPPGPTKLWGMSGPEDQRVVILDGVAHEVVPEMIDLTAEFLRTGSRLLN